MTQIDHPSWLRLLVVLRVWRNFGELRKVEVRRIPLPRTPVNRTPLSPNLPDRKAKDRRKK